MLAALHRQRMALRLSARRALGSKGNATENFFGLKVQSDSYRSLMGTFAELFVRREYPVLDEKDGGLILDCGANIGLASLYFKSILPNSRIIAFEPSPSTFQTLRSNIERNGVTGVELHNEALAREPGTLELFADLTTPDSPVASAMQNTLAPNAQSIARVPAVRLSDHINGPVELLKLDIEGGEHDVLHDLLDSGKIKHVRRMLIELHHHLTPQDNRMGLFLSLLERAGMGYHLRPCQRWTWDVQEFQAFIVDTYWPNGRPAA